VTDPLGAPASTVAGALLDESHGPHVGIDSVFVAHAVVTATDSIAFDFRRAQTAGGSAMRP
jgi:hypothetical protein